VVMAKKKKIVKLGKFLLKLAATSVALYLVSRKLDLEHLKALLLDAEIPYLILAFALFTLAQILEARRTNVFFRVLEIGMSELMNAKLYLLGMFYNLFLPGGIGGDAYRVYWIQNQFKTGYKSLITAFVLNRVNSLVALGSLMLASCVNVAYIHPTFSYAFVLIPIAVVGYHLVLKWFFPRYTATTVLTTSYSFVIRILQVAAAHFVLRALGVDQDYGAYWFIFLLSGFAFILPIFLGGYGSRELVFLYSVEYLPMIDLTAIVAMSLVIYGMRALLGLGGVYFLMYPNKILDKTT